MGGKSKNQRQNKSGAASQKPAKKHIAFHASKKSAAYQFVEPGYGEDFSLDANQKEFKTGHGAGPQEPSMEIIVCLTNREAEVYQCMKPSCGEEFTNLNDVNEHEFRNFHRPNKCGEWLCTKCKDKKKLPLRYIRKLDADNHLKFHQSPKPPVPSNDAASPSADGVDSL